MVIQCIEFSANRHFQVVNVEPADLDGTLAMGTSWFQKIHLSNKTRGDFEYY